MTAPHTRRLTIGGLVLVLGTAPLLLYVLFGPRDGNPVGLGILMWLSWLAGGVLVIWGFVGLLRSILYGKRDT
jgi:hypothetical protein